MGLPCTTTHGDEAAASATLPAPQQRAAAETCVSGWPHCGEMGPL